MKKIFLDSDIMLDALLKRPGFELPAMNLLALIGNKQFAAATSSIAFVNVSYFLNKFDSANRTKLLTGIRRLVSIIDVGGAIIDMALKSDFADFEDAIQQYAAVNLGCNAIITRSIKDYKHSTLPVLTDEQFLRTL